ncbi:hypothetical protein HY251_17160 [bacterium]|nr:hypothetical protein [bacterium]
MRSLAEWPAPLAPCRLIPSSELARSFQDPTRVERAVFVKNIVTIATKNHYDDLDI